MKTLNTTILLILSFLLFQSYAVFEQEGSHIVKQEMIGKLSADSHVERGLVLSRHGLSHLISLQSWELEGLPSIETLSEEKRQALAVKELNHALLRQKELVDYSLYQVQNFLGRAYMLLGTELLRQNERLEKKKTSLDKASRYYFSKSVFHYRLALQNAPETFKYSFVEDLVRTAIASGDLNKALAFIEEFERGQIKPNPNSDHALLRMKAEIYLIMGRHEEAGLVYEEWIRRGNIQSFLSVNSAVYCRLYDLLHKTGHPQNLPRQEIQLK